MSSSPLAQFIKWEKEIPQQLFLRQPFNGQWKTWTYQQAGEEIRRIANGLQSLGFPAGSKVGLLSKNCAHWIMADLAIMMAGYVSVPLYATITASSIHQILEHSESKLVIVGKLDDYSPQRQGIPSNVVKLGINAYGIDENHSWEQWIKQFEPLKNVHLWQPDELLTIMYTSGTTGKPKGVMHNVSNFDATLTQAIGELGIQQHPVLFSYLPLSHIAERMGIEVMGLYQGGTFSFPETLETFPKNLADTQPTHFFAVPRIWAKFHEKILEKLPQKKLNTLLAIPLVSTLIKNKIKKGLGLSRAKQIFSGAAPISVDLLKWYQSIGVNILQAYGMTEDCVYAHFNRVDNNRHGTVGLPLKGLSVKIADHGEIRVKCPGLTQGYYKEPEMTKELFDEEGYLKTGDQGEVSKEGFLTITGRVKDLFKTDKGKYIAPAPIEMKLLSNPDIEQVCVVGMGVPQPIALTVLSASGKTKTKEHLINSISKTLNELNPELESHEQVEKAVIMKDDWSVENNLLTPTLKVKRNEVEKIHLPHYPKWYHTEGKVVWE
ncbi:MAG: AMP-binding protein [Cyclobacteriaceae bacterium]|nr:AMP-binding protein [Cyclobacteriaceae bacterium]UYN86766.1 MAG: AMP-binding protein [Cyclobacteriaceae bacterium]